MNVPTVLVIAGLNGSPRFFQHATDRLFPGMEVVYYDHLQDPAKGGVQGLAERAWAETADRANGAPIYVAGESFGGTIALELARAHQDQLAGLILFSTFAKYPARHAWYRRPGLTLWRVLGDRAAETILLYSRPFELPSLLGVPLSARLAREFLRLPPSYGPAYLEKCRLALQFDAEPWLREIRVPALVIVPHWDPAVPPSAGLTLAAGLPRATLRRIPGGHLAHLVHPELVGGMIDGWRQTLAEGACLSAAAVEAHPARL